MTPYQLWRENAKKRIDCDDETIDRILDLVAQLNMIGIGSNPDDFIRAIENSGEPVSAEFSIKFERHDTEHKQ